MEEEIGDSNIRTCTMYILYMQYVLYVHTKYVLTYCTYTCSEHYIRTNSYYICKYRYSPCLTYLSQLFPTPNSSYHTRSSSSSQLNLPAVRSSYGQRAFSFAGASMWRSLPATTRQMRDFRAFSAKCKDLLI